MTELILRLNLHDERFLHAVVARRRPWLDAVLHAATHLGGATGSVGVAVLLLFSPMPDLAAAGALATFALVLSHTLVQLIKRVVSRPRPEMPVGLECLIRAPDRFSFPSGHSAASLAVALPVAAALGAAGVVVLLLAAVVGFSRCYLGVHYPGDVLAGWLLAFAGVGIGALIGL